LVQNHVKVTSPEPNKPLGRIPTYDWESFYAEIAVLADLNGLPERQGELIKTMTAWCMSEWGKEPAESMIKKKISRLYGDKRKTGA
jgi:hypothetical protein